MTRINVVEVKYLTNEWLLAEYRELLRVPNKIISGKTRLDKTRIPSSYRMGKGHEIFFHDKLKWLHKRHEQLKTECIKRNININTSYSFDYDNLPPHAKKYFYNDWKVTTKDQTVNTDRLKERFSLRKKSYSFTEVVLVDNKRFFTKIKIDNRYTLAVLCKL